MTISLLMPTWVQSHRPLPRAGGPCNEAGVAGVEPHPAVKLVPTQPGLTNVFLPGPCHYRAIHSGLDRSPADNHGQRHGGLDLRCSLPSQVTNPPDLALGAGGRRSAFVHDGASLPRSAHGRVAAITADVLWTLLDRSWERALLAQASIGGKLAARGGP
jgi:hypothetical protein